MKNKKKLFAIIIGVLGILCIGLFFLFNMLKKNTYVITFDTDGGSIIATVTVEEGNTIPKPLDPVKEGYKFVNWNYNNVQYDFLETVKSDMVLKAVWEEDNVEPDKYEITFTIGDEVKKIEAASFDEIDLNSLGFVEKEGYAIKWYLDGEEYDEEKPLTENISLEGKYVKVSSFKIKFNSSGGSKVSDQTVKEGETVKEPENVTKEGYVLDGWYLNSEKYDFSTKVNKNFTLTAKWSEDPNVKRYTVTFKTNGGSSVSSQRVMENKTATEPAKPTKKKFVFVEWQLNEKKFDFKTKITEDIELSAKWRELERYKVTFQMDDGTSIFSSEVNEGETVSEPAKPTKKGYVFKYWKLDDAQFDFKTKIMKNTTLTAYFEEEKKVQNFEVKFDTDGGTPSVTTIVVESGRVINEPSTKPKKNGCEIDYWALNGSRYNWNTLISRNITLKAVYKTNCIITPEDDEPLPPVQPTTYTVTFNSNGGSSVQSQTVTAGSKANEPTAPTKANSTFAGWYLGNSQYNFSNTPVTSDITLVAHWTENVVVNNYTISYTNVGIGSPDVYLRVYLNGNEVSYRSIDGDFCMSTGGSPCAVNPSDLSPGTYTVVLANGTTVQATLAS